MRLGGFPGRAAQGLSLLLYSPGSHGGHIKWPPARAELATNLPLCHPARESGVLVRKTLPAKKGQVNFGSVLSGETVRVPAVICSHLSHGNRRRLRKYIARFNRPFNAKWAASPSRKRPPNLYE